MTDLTLADIEAALVATTPGEWSAYDRGGLDRDDDTIGWEIKGPPEPINRGQFARKADAVFIARAHDEIVPWLVAQVKELEGRCLTYSAQNAAMREAAWALDGSAVCGDEDRLYVDEGLLDKLRIESSEDPEDCDRLDMFLDAMKRVQELEGVLDAMKRVQELEGVLDGLLGFKPGEASEYDQRSHCGYCLGYDLVSMLNEVEHRAGCPWTAAKKARVSNERD
ncbi:MAG: hypothetical protein ACRDGM_18005 [bacterium]